MTPDHPEDAFSSTDDARVANNTMRQQYRTLSDNEKGWIDLIKAQGETLLESLSDVTHEYPDAGREFALARTKLEESVMWGVKGITK